MQRSIFIICFLFGGFFGTSLVKSQDQHSHERCVTHYPSAIGHFESWLRQKTGFKISETEKVHRIPVVIHILHMGEAIGEGTNLSESVIMSQLEVINEDFRRKAGTRGHNEHPSGGDSKIEFVLAQYGPDGQPTNGIVRVDVTQKEFPNSPLNTIALSAYFSLWDPENYLNVWSFPWLPENTLLGEARFPESDLPGLPEESKEGWTLPSGEEADGVAVNAHHFGVTGKAGVYSLGRTLTHEIGHFLGLFHVWGPNDLDRDGCELDDFCEDTPPTRVRTSGCPSNLLACDGRPAMIENYMDYADDACMNIFTHDQIKRMRTVLENSPRRKSLLQSPALDPVLSIPNEPAVSVTVFPNPVNDRLRVAFENHVFEQVQVVLHNLNGKELLKREFSANSDKEVELQLPQLSDQVLLLTLTGKSFSLRKKIILN